MNKFKIYTSLLIFLLLLVPFCVAEQISYRIDEDGNPIPEEGSNEENQQKIDTIVASIPTQQNEIIKKIASAAKQSLQASGASSITYDPDTKLITLKNSNGEDIITIPQNFNLETKSDGSLIIKSQLTNPLSIVSSLFSGEGLLPTFKGTTIYAGQAIISEVGANTQIEIVGEGIIGLSEFPYLLENIKDAILTLDESQNIIKASFTSTTENTPYFFAINDEIYKITANKDSKIEFDKEKGLLKASQLKEFEHDGKIVNGRTDHKYNILDSESEVKDFSIQFDEEGNPTSVSFTGGQFYNENEESTERDTYTATKGSLTVFFEGNEKAFHQARGRNENENLVYYGTQDILLNGRVLASIHISKENLGYIGRSEGAYTQINRDTAFFDVKKGDVQIQSEQYSARVQQGEVIVTRIGTNGDQGFTIKHPLGEGASETVEIKANNEVYVTRTDTNGNQLFEKPATLNLASLSIGESLKNNEIIGLSKAPEILRQSGSYIEKQLEALEAAGKKGSETWYALKKLQIENNMRLTALTQQDQSNTISEIQSTLREMEQSNQINQDYASLAILGGDLATQQLQSLSETDVSYTQTLQNAQALYEQAYQYGFLSPQEKTIKLAGIEIAKGNYEEAYNMAEQVRQEYQAIGNRQHTENEYNLQTIAQAEIMKAKSLFMQNAADKPQPKSLDPVGTQFNVNPRLGITDESRAEYKERINERNKEAYDLLTAATNSDPNNKEAQTLKENFERSQFASLESLADQERRLLSVDLSLITNDLGIGASSTKQFLVDFMTIVGSPYTTIANFGVEDFWFGEEEVGGNFEEYINQAEGEALHAKKIGNAAHQFSLLQDAGIDPQDFVQKGYWDKFLDVYKANGYDDMISTSEMRTILASEAFQSQTTAQGKAQYLLDIMEKEYGINQDNVAMQSRIASTVKNMVDIEYGIQNSETLKGIAFKDGYTPLPDRLSQQIGLDTTSSAALFVADIVLNPLNLIGAGFGARAASLEAKIAAGTATKITLLTLPKASLQSFRNIATKQLMKSYMTEILADSVITSGLMATAAFDPEAAKFLGVVGAAAGMTAFGKATLDSFATKVSKVDKNALGYIYRNTDSNILYGRNDYSFIEIRGALSNKEGKALSDIEFAKFLDETKGANGALTYIEGKEYVFKIDTEAAAKYPTVEQSIALQNSVLGGIGQSNINTAISVKVSANGLSDSAARTFEQLDATVERFALDGNVERTVTQAPDGSLRYDIKVSNEGDKISIDEALKGEYWEGGKFKRISEGVYEIDGQRVMINSRENAFEGLYDTLPAPEMQVGETGIQGIRGKKYVDSFQERKVDPSEVLPVRASQEGISQSPTGIEIYSFTDAQRLGYAERKLGRTLTQEESRAVLAAHYSEVDTSNFGRIRTKTEILQEGGFDSNEIRTLMESHITGKGTITDVNGKTYSLVKPTYTQVKDIANAPVKIPLPDANELPVVDSVTMNQFIGEPYRNAQLPPDIQLQSMNIRQKIVDNIDYIDPQRFEAGLKSATETFNANIGDEDYIVVFVQRGGSEQYTYEMASQWLEKKPVGFAFQKKGDGFKASLQEFFDDGVRNVVLFDDVAYSGTGVAYEIGAPVAAQFDSAPQGEYMFYAVLSHASEKAYDRFYGNKKLFSESISPNGIEKQAVLFEGGGGVKNIRDIVDWSTVDQTVLQDLETSGIFPEQTLTYTYNKVPDSLSMPRGVSAGIKRSGNPNVPFMLEDEIYRIPVGEYWDKWQALYDLSDENGYLLIRFIAVFFQKEILLN